MTTTVKKLGIWMDHSMANLMEFTTDPILTKTIHSDTSQHGKSSDFGKNENLMHNKEQHQQSEYFKKLGEAIKNYDEVILFGPTTAKAQLLNLLAEDQHFAKIKIEVKQTDKMTENQQHSFIKEYFTKH
jgi:stalled ribosome rescue protein Dom34